MSEALRRFVGERLHTLVGYSEAAVVDYVVAVATKAKSRAALQSQLADMLPDSAYVLSLSLSLQPSALVA